MANPRPPSVLNAAQALLPGSARLRVETPDGVSFEHPLQAPCTIGRHPHCALLLDDREVSKEHARIEILGREFWVRDLQSSNGTFVNGQRTGAQQLRAGDRIRLGATTLTLLLPPSPSAPPRGITVLEADRVLSNVLASVRGVDADQFRPAEAIPSGEALRQDYEKLRVAFEFQRQIGGETSVEVVLDRLLDFAFDMLRADNGAVLVKRADGSLDVQVVRRRAGQTDDMAVSGLLLSRVLESREGFLTADAVMDQRFVASKSIVAHGIRSAMAVPLVAKGEVLGVIFLDTRERTGAFTDKDLRILAALGAQAAGVLESTELRRRLQAEERQRESLSRFLPPGLVDQVAKGEVTLPDTGEQRNVTVLFADIRGFTSLAETQAPHDVVRMLKGYFELMAEAVFDQRGIVDKFIGDAVMALWGAPEPLEDAPLRACRAAVEMQTKLAVFNLRRRAAGQPDIGVGIGINTGSAVVGLMGSIRRPEYTAIGDTVNVASRLCGLAKAGQVLISGATAQGVGRQLGVNALPDVQVKGRAQRVSVYEVSLGLLESTLVR